MVRDRFASYLRVSTGQQRQSGLGLEAQRHTVAVYLAGRPLLAEFVEVESGKRNDRPQLVKALAHAKATGATLILPRVDRLARNTRFLLTIIDSGANVAFCDMPNLPAGATGRFILTQLAAVAELEGGLISERTKAALAAAKRRGTKLGNPNGAKALRRYIKQNGNAAGVAGALRKLDDHARALVPVVEAIRAAGFTSLRAIAAQLAARGIRTVRGGKWTAGTARALLRRQATPA